MNNIPLAKHFIDDDDIQGVINTLKSGYLSLGPNYKDFEEGIKKYIKSKYACAVTNGTSGLHLAVIALNIKEGDEVITTPFSFVASTNCLLYEKVKPVFVDIEEDTFNIDPKKIEEKITSKTKAILVAHIFGQGADIKLIKSIAKKYNLKLIEDACESLGAKYKSKMLGTFGDIGVFGFFPNKQMTTGEGGMIVTNNKKIYNICDRLRHQGKSEKANFMHYQDLGYNYRMNAMSASLGVSQLKKIDMFVDKRVEIANYYNECLKDIKGIILPKVAPNRTHSWFSYVIRVLNGKRNKLADYLLTKEIITKPYFPCIHLQPYIKEKMKSKKGDLPVAEKISSQTLSLPVYFELTKPQIKYISESIMEFMKL